jgi:hypothetical protein
MTKLYRLNEDIASIGDRPPTPTNDEGRELLGIPIAVASDDSAAFKGLRPLTSIARFCPEFSQTDGVVIIACEF